MSFTPLCNPAHVADRELTDSQVIDLVAEGATRFATQLDSARDATNDWSDDRLGYALVDHCLARLLLSLAATGRWGRENQLPSGTLWKIAGPLLATGWLQLRAREKPLGYAGDFELLAAIIDGKCCDDPLGRLFDRYFQNQAAPEAVRSRTEHVAHALAAHMLAQPGKTHEVVSVGAATGADIQLGLDLLDRTIRKQAVVRLFDLDQRSLDYAHARIRQLIPESQIDCIRENLFRLPKKSKSQSAIGHADFVICSGLFDYLEDDVGAEMLRLFWDSLRPGGRLLVGNFMPHHATRAYMEWIGNWYLHYRTAAELATLATFAEIPAQFCQLGMDRTGSDLFLSAVKP